MAQLIGSVGDQGKNLRQDVELVQHLLKEQAYYKGRVDGICGSHTLAAIRSFQSKFLSRPDGLIDVGGRTWHHLIASTAVTVKPVLLQWTGDSARWPEEKKILSMHPQLRPKVQKVLSALKDRGFQPKVFYGWRSVVVQLKIYAQGHTKVKFSFHNAQKPDGTPNSYAADIVDKRYGWEPGAKTSGFWKALGEEAKKQGLHWGGDWTSFPDEAHVQLVANSQLAHVKAESGL